MSAILGPIAPYSNLPINAEFYQPSAFIISNISLGLTTIVTTSVAHNYVIGQYVRLLIPQAYGSYQLNNLNGYIISIPSTTQAQVNINSLNANAFVPNPVTNNPNKPQIIAVGDINSGQTNISGRSSNITYIPGSFINISP